MSLTLIKCRNKHATLQDLEKLQSKFEAGESLDNEDIEMETIEVEPAGLTLVKIGNHEYTPTQEDLQAWKKVFEDAAGDPDFKIFSHGAVHVEHIPMSVQENFVIIGSADTLIFEQHKVESE